MVDQVTGQHQIMAEVLIAGRHPQSIAAHLDIRCPRMVAVRTDARRRLMVVGDLIAVQCLHMAEALPMAARCPRTAVEADTLCRRMVAEVVADPQAEAGEEAMLQLRAAAPEVEVAANREATTDANLRF
jgi:hypothetical protein